jgi:hypothetical protein
MSPACGEVSEPSRILTRYKLRMKAQSEPILPDFFGAKLADPYRDPALARHWRLMFDEVSIPRQRASLAINGAQDEPTAATENRLVMG